MFYIILFLNYYLHFYYYLLDFSVDSTKNKLPGCLNILN